MPKVTMSLLATPGLKWVVSASDGTLLCRLLRTVNQPPLLALVAMAHEQEAVSASATITAQ